MRSMSMPVSASMRRFLPRLTYTGWHRMSRGRTWRSTGPGSPPSCWRCSGRRRRMAETLMDISADDLLYEAWAVIAYAGWAGADKPEGWQEAAGRWRDEWHAYLDETTDAEEE